MDGFYAVYYTGQAGSGFGMLVMKDGVIAGADVTGGTYDGTFTTSGDSLNGTVRMIVPANQPLVTGAGPSAQPYSINFPISLSASRVQQGQPVTIKLPTGPVNLILRKVRNFIY